MNDFADPTRSRLTRGARHNFQADADDLYASAAFNDPANFILLRHPSGRLHRVNRRELRLIDVLTEQCGWRREPLAHGGGR